MRDVVIVLILMALSFLLGVAVVLSTLKSGVWK